MTKLHYHDAVVGVLQAIASLDMVLGPDELICLWFDDVYSPCQECPEGIDPDVWARGDAEWRACFSDSELEVLARFHSVFDSLLEDLSEDPQSFGSDPGWIRVASAAKAALQNFAC